MRVAARGITSITELNALPFAVRANLYLRLIPDALLAVFAIDRRSLLEPDGRVRITAPDDASWGRVELRATAEDRDPVLLVDVGMSAFAVPELSLVQINDPRAPRFSIDRDEDGQDTLLGTAGRNLPEEHRELGAGLAPGQVRRGLRMLGEMLTAMDAFCRLLGREFYLVEPLFYHSAILYERRGCGYLMGREIMEEINKGFAPHGPLTEQLDGASPFRPAGAANTVRGRSWALHDGLSGQTWGGVKMYKAAGRPANLNTFPGAVY